MPVLLVADCQAARARLEPVLPHLVERMRQTHGPDLHQRRLDLDDGPTVGRVRMAIGLGWHAREWVRRAARETHDDVVAVLEACGCGRHHLLGLGRAHIPALRWSVNEASDGRSRVLETASAQEGAVTFVPTAERARGGGPDLRMLEAHAPDEVAAVFAAALHVEPVDIR